ncbi:hypothetical protein A2154_01865 [Candidatus Gottesmanbacteria bacterium RBG_16_43_7]|uniref:ribose-phosphate diphosphokinase n=1 Tax=Candidatus Gottesmanbacteria bacterium RBG_16_43_7 TaxID=1798373 RepID=A0A1F5Z7M7_9BACT|nr:MAG: hypothetical protein A2154_01865 [Candidatus Gottesmanbacteria bacterium RBG_16_43_7]
MNHVAVYSGSSNTLLSKNLATRLNAYLAKVEISRFSNGEARVWVREEKVPKTAIIVQSLSKPVDEHIVEFCLLADAVHRLGATDLIAVIPWLGYSKQDKVFRTGEPLSVKVIAKMLQVVPVQRLLTFDLHNLAILGFFEIPVINVSARHLFAQHFKKIVDNNTLVAAPDEGSVKSSTSFAQELGVPIVYMDKKRDLKTGDVKVIGISRPVRGSNIVIIDDMIVTGSTIMETARYLKRSGARSIHVGATHLLYVGNVQKLIDKSNFDSVVTTDTITPDKSYPAIKILPVADLVAVELENQTV